LEAQLHQQVCDYLRMQYPGIIFHSDFGSGIKLTMGQAAKQKRLQSGRSWPDLQIVEPRHGAHGMFVELKREGTRIYLKNGNVTADKHIQEQLGLLAELRFRGYHAVMCSGFDEARVAIDRYLNYKAPNPTTQAQTEG
jgi:hypothetical protein